MADDQTNAVNTDPLRNASPLPESDSDSETYSEQESPHPGPHIQQPEQTSSQTIINHRDRTFVYLQQVGLQALLWIQAFLNVMARVASTSQTIGLGVVRSLQSQVYVFFKGSHYPYRMQDYTVAGPGIAPVEWYYNADTKQFISNVLYNTSTEHTTHHFEWLSGQIKYNDLVLYDISDFLQQIRWASHLSPGDGTTGTARPSIAHVLAAWSLSSGKVLNAVEGLTLQTINADGTESTLHCRG